eukprot:TRINITY_DN10094_c1_g2_i1.p1 TRINITY_DN10094_c1_g2~~TRINITY_DN10094_c1_g2_i1.p1  ORF type:complete len:510 (-),score=81.18 TRINITY_DN10094_c1_g2_i1:565-2094(-)
MEPDILNLVTNLHRKALLLLSHHTGQPLQGCAAGAKRAGLTGILRRRLHELDTVKGWCGKISCQKADTFLKDLEDALRNDSTSQTLLDETTSNGQTLDASSTDLESGIDCPFGGAPRQHQTGALVDSFNQNFQKALHALSGAAQAEPRLRALEVAVANLENKFVAATATSRVQAHVEDRRVAVTSSSTHESDPGSGLFYAPGTWSCLNVDAVPFMPAENTPVQPAALSADFVSEHALGAFDQVGTQPDGELEQTLPASYDVFFDITKDDRTDMCVQTEQIFFCDRGVQATPYTQALADASTQTPNEQKEKENESLACLHRVHFHEEVGTEETEPAQHVFQHICHPHHHSQPTSFYGETGTKAEEDTAKQLRCLQTSGTNGTPESAGGMMPRDDPDVAHGEADASLRWVDMFSDPGAGDVSFSQYSPEASLIGSDVVYAPSVAKKEKENESLACLHRFHSHEEAGTEEKNPAQHDYQHISHPLHRPQPTKPNAEPHSKVEANKRRGKGYN